MDLPPIPHDPADDLGTIEGILEYQRGLSEVAARVSLMTAPGGLLSAPQGHSIRCEECGKGFGLRVTIAELEKHCASRHPGGTPAVRVTRLV